MTEALKEMLKNEPPVDNTGMFIASGPLVSLMSEASRLCRQIDREHKKAERDMNVRTNYPFCRKKCKLFKVRSCFKKTFEEQKACVESKGYEKEDVVIPEVV